MKKSQYDKYIIKEVCFEKYAVQHPEITKPSLRLKSADNDIYEHHVDFFWVPVTKPFEMASETHAHDFDSFFIFTGGDLTNMLDLGGEVEFTLGEEGKELEKFLFTTATMVYVPKRLLHCPLNFKKVNDSQKPILFQNFFFTSEYKRNPNS